MQSEDHTTKQKQYDAGPKASHGYGGQFGVEKGNQDKVGFPFKIAFSPTLYSSSSNIFKVTRRSISAPSLLIRLLQCFDLFESLGGTQQANVVQTCWEYNNNNNNNTHLFYMP